MPAGRAGAVAARPPAGGGGGGGGVPPTIAGLAAWFDSSDAGSFSYHSGVVVSQWNDLSGLGRHLTQPTSGSAPSRDATLNGLDVVTFDGSNDRMVAAGLDSLCSGENNLTIVAVVNLGTTANGLALGTNTSSSTRGIGLVRASASSIQVRLNNAATTTNRAQSGLGTDAWRTIVATLDATAGPPWVPTVRTNAVVTSSTETTAAPQASAAGGFAVGSRSATGTAFASCRWAELVIYDNIISAGDIATLESYLQAKWATW